jgi:hypothetical protein
MDFEARMRWLALTLNPSPKTGRGKKAAPVLPFSQCLFRAEPRDLEKGGYPLAGADEG